GSAWIVIDNTFGGKSDKNLQLGAWKLAIALQEAGWLVRCDAIWHHPNSTPESAFDRPSRSHEYILMLTKRPDYFGKQTVEPAVCADDPRKDEGRVTYDGKWDGAFVSI